MKEHNAQSKYQVSEILTTIQGEGHLKGTPFVLLRLSGCNLHCTEETAGFRCDTRHSCRQELAARQLASVVSGAWECARFEAATSVYGEPILPPGRANILITGGEPMLQLDRRLCSALRASMPECFVAVETNGTVSFNPDLVDWISCSPKRGVKVKLTEADEVRCVLSRGMPADDRGIRCEHRFVSPAYEYGKISRANLEWCVRWCIANPQWRLSTQDHRYWRLP